ncbi:hypothetical protein C7974DRAFT_148324 [Boeremia exigua]|uniref:uncharacterized protein n=1 Tax=Boeremia exigua TaxID=749465 RepID=UPI001E8D8784|nr:uncharacterized protein C7974DRAFT_148324 [Boeremia exigua]KAH6637786.1 hypothetical protein C7974DRAFT_148324 [Boeremia exigua]
MCGGDCVRRQRSRCRACCDVMCGSSSDSARRWQTLAGDLALANGAAARRASVVWDCVYAVRCSCWARTGRAGRQTLRSTGPGLLHPGAAGSSTRFGWRIRARESQQPLHAHATCTGCLTLARDLGRKRTSEGHLASCLPLTAAAKNGLLRGMPGALVCKRSFGTVVEFRALVVSYCTSKYGSQHHDSIGRSCSAVKCIVMKLHGRHPELLFKVYVRANPSVALPRAQRRMRANCTRSI